VVEKGCFMDWIQFSIFFIGVVGLWLWSRSESNSDRRDMINLVLAGQKETRDEFKEAREENKLFREKWDSESKEFREENKLFREKWMEESKDFHGRLIAIEERNRGK
jgi:hypothetical protein